MQDYIDLHLNEKITLGDLAQVSLYSPWYSYRLFVKWLNVTPADYIRKFRLLKVRPKSFEMFILRCLMWPLSLDLVV